MSTPTVPDLGALSPLAKELALTIARVASDIALVMDRHGVISTVAEGAAVQALGCGQWLGRRWEDTVVASSRAKIQTLLQEVLDKGSAGKACEVNHPGPQGEALPVNWSAIRLGLDGPVLAAGRDLRAVAAIQQRFIEAQQDLESHYRALGQAESCYRLLFQVVHDAVLVVDAIGLQVLDANGAAAELLGLPLARLRGRRLSDSLPSAARSPVARLLAAAIREGRPGEVRISDSRLPGGLDFSATPFQVGPQLQIMLRARPVVAEPGPAGAQALSRMAEFVEIMPDAIVITDYFGAILLANPAFLRLVGESDALQLRQRSLPELLFERDGAWERLVAGVRDKGMVSNEVLDVRAGDGAMQRLRASAALMANGEQACIGFVLRTDHRLPAHLAGDDVLTGLLDQVGRVPLADLLVEVAYRAERRLIESALLRAHGQRDLAAEALCMTPETLELRIQRLGLDAHGHPPDAGETPPLMN